LTLRTVGEHLGVFRSTLYRHFADKQSPVHPFVFRFNSAVMRGHPEVGDSNAIIASSTDVINR
jgi:Bacterial regulatory proteins, tetR family